MGTRGKRRPIPNQEVREGKDHSIILLRSVSDLRNLGIQHNCYDKFILDVEKLVQYIPDVQLEFTEMDSTLSGSFSMQDGHWLIRVNKLHDKKRQRFTIAHELGHYVYHKEDGQEFVDTTFFRGMTSDNLEYTANKFASELLMPEEQVRQLIDRENVRNIADLASRFGVSSSAMLYRVKELKYKTKE